MRKLEDLKRELSENRIDRREFINRATALGMAAAIPAAILSEEARASAPKRGGKLRQVSTAAALSDTLDGALVIGYHAANTNWQIRNNVTQMMPDGSVGPDLAESWESSPDASQWRFHLRKGVEFHNGKSLEAEDVIYSINHHRGEGVSSGASGVVAGITDIRADGKHTVVFDLNTGTADFPHLLGDWHLIIAPTGTEGMGDGKGWDEGIGTGPFILTEWAPGERSATKRNPNYFVEGLPYFDEVETVNIADGTARVSALLSGRFDVIEDPPINVLGNVEKTAGLRVLEVSGTAHMTFPMQTNTEPFTNNDTRLALKYAIDREQLLKIVLQGHGSFGNDHPISSAQAYHAKDLPQRQYDPDKAKFHLNKAGLSELSVELIYGDVIPGGTESAVLYKEHASKAGINFELTKHPVDGYWSSIWNVKPFYLGMWGGRATADWMFSVGYAEEAAWNETRWKHERFNQLLVEARAELDEPRRHELYYEMQQICRDEGGVVIPVFFNWIAGVTDKVGVPEVISGIVPLDGGRNASRWWFV